MAYVVWKVIDGYGPYAYLYESVWVDGRSRVRHLEYLGRWRGEDANSVKPGSVVHTPDGQEVRVPDFSPSVRRHLGSRLVELVHPGAETDLGSRPKGMVATGAEAGLGSNSAAELGSSPDDVDGDLGSRRGAEPDPVGDGAEPRPTPVRPRRLSDGSWGVLSQRPLAPGDPVMVSTTAGQSWIATVTEVLEPVQQGYVARASGRPQSSR